MNRWLRKTNGYMEEVDPNNIERAELSNNNQLNYDYSFHPEKPGWNQADIHSLACIHPPKAEKIKKEKEFLQNISPNKKVFLKNLHHKLGNDQILDLLKGYGVIVRLKVPFNKSKNRNLGYGYAIFENEESVEKLLALKNPLRLQGKEVQFTRFNKYEESWSRKEEPSTKLDSKVRDSALELYEKKPLPEDRQDSSQSEEGDQDEVQDNPFEGVLNPSMSLHHRFLKPTQKEYHLLRPSIMSGHTVDNLRFRRSLRNLWFNPNPCPNRGILSRYGVKSIPGVDCQHEWVGDSWHPMKY